MQNQKRNQKIFRKPNRRYKNEGWISWGDFLGTGNVATFNRKYRGFEDAREFARSLGLKSADDWATYCASEKLPKDIPLSPEDRYKQE